MKNSRKDTAVARRDLLKVAPLAGLAVCAPNAAEAGPQDPPETPDDPRDVRLADTEHVRTYYKLARG